MIKKTLITIGGVLKAFWSATIKTTWGIVGIYLLAGMIVSMDIDASRITDLLSMTIILIKSARKPMKITLIKAAITAMIWLIGLRRKRRLKKNSLLCKPDSYMSQLP